MDRIGKMLDEVIEQELTELKLLKPENKHEAIENINKLYKLRIEESKNEGDLLEKAETRENEQLLKREQYERSKKIELVKLGLEAAGIILPLMVYVLWMNKGFKFEETGTYTSTTFKNLFGNIKPKK